MFRCFGKWVLSWLGNVDVGLRDSHRFSNTLEPLRSAKVCPCPFPGWPRCSADSSWTVLVSIEWWEIVIWPNQKDRIGIWKKLMTQEKNSTAIATFSIQFFRSPVSWGLWWHDRSSKRKWHHSAWWTLPRPGGSLLESGIRVASESNLSTLSGKMTRLGCGHDIIQSKKYICIIYSSLRTSTLELPGMVLVLRLETIIWVEAISKCMHFVLYRIQPREKISIEPILCRTKGTPKDLNRIEDQDVVGCIYRPSLYSNFSWPFCRRTTQSIEKFAMVFVLSVSTGTNNIKQPRLETSKPHNSCPKSFHKSAYLWRIGLWKGKTTEVSENTFGETTAIFPRSRFYRSTVADVKSDSVELNPARKPLLREKTPRPCVTQGFYSTDTAVSTEWRSRWPKPVEKFAGGSVNLSMRLERSWELAKLMFSSIWLMVWWWNRIVWWHLALAAAQNNFAGHDPAFDVFEGPVHGARIQDTQDHKVG